MGTLKNILLVVLCCFLATAAPPTPPTYFYGQVAIYSIENPARGVDVTATWVDSDGIEKTTTAMTDEEGFYYFNHGFVQAKTNSIIKIQAGEFTNQIQSDPYGQIIKVQTIIIGGDAIQPNKNEINEIEPNADEPTSESTGQEESNLDLNCPTCKPTPGDNQTTESKEEANIGENYNDNNKNNINETQTNVEKKPLSNLLKSKIWPNVNLSKNKKEILTKQPEKTITEKILETQKDLANSIQSAGKNFIDTFKKSELLKGNFSEMFKKPNKNIGPLLIRIVAIVFGLLILYKLLRLISKMPAFKGLQIKAAENAIKKLYNSNAKKFMETEFEVVSPKDNLEEVIRRFITSNVNFVIVEDLKSPVGIITKKDVIKVDFSKDLMQITAREVMTKPLKTISEHEKFSEILVNIKKLRISSLIVMKKQKIVGIVTTATLAGKYNEFFNEFYSENSYFPYVTKAKSDNVIMATESEPLRETIKKMIEANCELIIVAKDGQSQEEISNNIIGSISEHEIVELIYNYPGAINKIDHKSALGTQECAITPGTNIIEASKKMAEKNTKKLVIVDNKQFIGVTTQNNILNCMDSYISQNFKINK